MQATSNVGEILNMNNKLHCTVSLAQINPTIGDYEQNSKKIFEFMSSENSKSADIIIFPELALFGLPIGNLISRFPFLVQQNLKWINELAKHSGKTAVAIGFVNTENINNETVYYNSLAIIRNKKIEKIINLSPLQQNTMNLCSDNTYEINGTKYLFLNSDIENIEKNINKFNTTNTDIIIICKSLKTGEAASYKKHEILSNLSMKYNLAIAHINQSGLSDNFLFDGESCIYSKKGKLIAVANSDEEILSADIYNCFEKELINITYKNTSEFSLNYEYDLERTYKTLIKGIRDYFAKNNLKRAVLGLSGGLDSSICAVLLTDALGKDNVLGISMPSALTGNESKSDAKNLAENLDINYFEYEIKPVVNTVNSIFNKMFSDIETKWNCRYDKSYTQDNVQARSRAVYLWGISNEFDSCIPIATSDKSELYMGYATINGDMSGGYAPIADITKTKLFALAKWLNKNRDEKNAIPENIILKKPGAELAIDIKTGKPLLAEDALMPYEFLDEIIWRIETKKQTYTEILKSDFLYETHTKITKEQKKEWIDKFFKRMSSALYKWSIMPPSVIIGDYSINKAIYKHPLTSRIDYKEKSAEDIAKLFEK
ncbi:MAG: NAD(+) synthase [bacterium]|nr:NAD(+) synthase [bacterium]